MNTKPKSKTDNLVTMNLENESLIYDLNNNRAYCLNKTSAMVWESCDGKTSTLEISNLLSHKLKTMVSEEFIWLALDELKKNNLLENGEDLNNYFPNLSRREIVKKIGLASMVALPIIPSAAAPNAIMASSCVGLVASGGMVGPTTFPDLNVSNDQSGQVCIDRLLAQCCSMIGFGSCSCSVVSCIGSQTCS